MALPVLRAIEVQLGDAVDVGGLLGERATRLAQVPESVRPDHVASDAPHVMVGVGVDHVPTAANHIVDVVDLQCEVVGERQRRRLVGCSLHDVGVVRWPHRLSGEHAVGGDVDALGRFARPVERVLGRWSRVPRNDGDLDAQTRLRFPQHQQCRPGLDDGTDTVGARRDHGEIVGDALLRQLGVSPPRSGSPRVMSFRATCLREDSSPHRIHPER